MYEWTRWLDHVTTPANTYKIKNNVTGETFLATITLDGEIMQQGTPQDQAHFNNIEGGIFDAHAALALLVNAVRQNGWDIEAIGDAVAEQTGEVTLTNTFVFPFNNSERTVALPAARSKKFLT